MDEKTNIADLMYCSGLRRVVTTFDAQIRQLNGFLAMLGKVGARREDIAYVTCLYGASLIARDDLALHHDAIVTGINNPSEDENSRVHEKAQRLFRHVRGAIHRIPEIARQYNFK
jgi:hypothetical protein